MNYARQAKVAVLWQYGSAVAAIISVPTSMVMARLLSPVDFGIIAAASFFVQLGGRLMNFGFNYALIQVKDLRPAHMSSVFVVNVVTSVMLWIAITVSAPWFGGFVRSSEAVNVIPVVAVTFVIQALASVPNTLLTRELRFQPAAISGWLSASTFSVVGIWLAYTGFGHWSLVYAMVAGEAVRAGVLIYAAKWLPSLRFSLSAMREIFSFGMGLHVRRLLDYAALNLDNLLVGRILGLTALGFYDKAFSVMNLTLARINTGGTFVSTRIFAIIHEDPERFRRAYGKVLLTATLINYPILLTMIVVAPNLIETLFGSRWLPTTVPFQVLCAAGMLKLLNQYAGSATLAKGWSWPEAWRQGIYTASIVAGVIFFSRWGLSGVAVGVLAATIVMTVLMQSLLRRATGLTWGDLLRPQVPAVVCSVGLAAVLICVDALTRAWGQQPPPWAVLALQAAAGAMFYVLFLLFCGYKEVRELVAETLADFAPALTRLVHPSMAGTDSVYRALR